MEIISTNSLLNIHCLFAIMRWNLFCCDLNKRLTKPTNQISSPKVCYINQTPQLAQIPQKKNLTANRATIFLRSMWSRWKPCPGREINSDKFFQPSESAKSVEIKPRPERERSSGQRIIINGVQFGNAAVAAAASAETRKKKYCAVVYAFQFVFQHFPATGFLLLFDARARKHPKSSQPIYAAP